MKVLIVSKTHMSNATCVGALDLTNNKSIRLLDENGHNQPNNTTFEVGEIWDINYTQRKLLKNPHTEDVLISSKEYIGKQSNVPSFIKGLGVNIWKGSPNVLFSGLLNFTVSGSGYISNTKGVPSQSVGFWIPDKDLVRNDYKDKVRFCYRTNANTYQGQKCLPYVGYENPVQVIKAGTLCRVSLARWWKADENTEERCYLQLSGWYL